MHLVDDSHVKVEVRASGFSSILKHALAFAFIVGVSAIVSAALFLFKNNHTVSPVPRVLSVLSLSWKENIKKTTDQYPPSKYFPQTLTMQFPQAEKEIAARYPLDTRGITAKAYAAMDRDTHELLLAGNLTEQLPIASITKVMTAMVALEKKPLDTILPVSAEAATIGEAAMGLTEGEKLTVEELLYGLILPSGNDAGEALAEGIFFQESLFLFTEDSRKKARATFMAAMNKKAQELGMYDTWFANPSGLDEKEQSSTTHSTVLDLLALADYALSNPTFAKISSTKLMTLPYKEGYHKAFYLFNILELDKSYPGVKGVKPGITDFAGETLMSYAENGNKKILLVLLGSEATKDDAVKLYDYIFEQLNVHVPCIGQLSFRCKAPIRRR